MISTSYLADLTDQEMMHRPAPGCNHIKWQVGHLIASENSMINQCLPGALPELPAGFAEKYTKETAGSDDEAAFDSKEDLMKLHEQQRTATLSALARRRNHNSSSTFHLCFVERRSTGRGPN